MEAFKENFPELISYICTFLHHRDIIVLSMVSRTFADYYPKGFSQWRYSILAVNEFILTIDHQIRPPPDDHDGEPLPIHAGISIVKYNDKSILYSYSGTCEGTEFYCSRIGHRCNIAIAIDDTKVEYTAYTY